MAAAGNDFHTRCKIHGRFVHVIIDEHRITQASTELVEEFHLLTNTHPQPYSISEQTEEKDLIVTKQAIVPFSIGRCYWTKITCDVVPMEDCQLVLGKDWFETEGARFDKKRQVCFLFKNGVQVQIPSFESNLGMSRNTYFSLKHDACTYHCEQVAHKGTSTSRPEMVVDELAEDFSSRYLECCQHESSLGIIQIDSLVTSMTGQLGPSLLHDSLQGCHVPWLLANTEVEGKSVDIPSLPSETCENLKCWINPLFEGNSPEAEPCQEYSNHEMSLPNPSTQIDIRNNPLYDGKTYDFTTMVTPSPAMISHPTDHTGKDELQTKDTKYDCYTPTTELKFGSTAQLEVPASELLHQISNRACRLIESWDRPLVGRPRGNLTIVSKTGHLSFAGYEEYVNYNKLAKKTTSCSQEEVSQQLTSEEKLLQTLTLMQTLLQTYDALIQPQPTTWEQTVKSFCISMMVSTATYFECTWDVLEAPNILITKQIPEYPWWQALKDGVYRFYHMNGD